MVDTSSVLCTNLPITSLMLLLELSLKISPKLSFELSLDLSLELSLFGLTEVFS